MYTIYSISFRFSMVLSYIEPQDRMNATPYSFQKRLLSYSVDSRLHPHLAHTGFRVKFVSFDVRVSGAPLCLVPLTLFGSGPVTPTLRASRGYRSPPLLRSRGSLSEDLVHCFKRNLITRSRGCLPEHLIHCFTSASLPFGSFLQIVLSLS